MPRIRTIKPEFYSNEKLSSLPPAIHLLAGALLCYADDEGYFNAHPGLVRAHCMPLRDDSLSPHDMLSELSKIAFLELATGTDGKNLGRIVKFLEHQNINRPTPSKLKQLWPLPNGSGTPHGGLTEDSSLERKGKERKVNGKELKNPLTPSEGANRPEAPDTPEEKTSKLRIVERHDPPTTALAVRGLPVNDEIRQLATLVVLATPWAKYNHWRDPQVTDDHRELALKAANEEGEWHGRSLGETLDGLAKWILYHTQDLSRAQQKMQGGVEKYFREAKYRTTREEFMQEVMSDGQPTRSEKSDAVFASAREQLRRNLASH